MYVNIAGLTERGLRRIGGGQTRNGGVAANDGYANLAWGGDTTGAANLPAAGDNSQPSTSNGRATGTIASPSNGSAAAPSYDDGFGPFPTRSADATNGSAATASNNPLQTNPSATAAQFKPHRTLRAQAAATEEFADEARGIEGPIPDVVEPSTAQAVQPFTISSPEYPNASRFEPAVPQNYRTMATTRAIDSIVIHITDGGANINGPINWFQNPSARVSAHYVIGQAGEVVQMVAHNDVAWHARSANSRSIGIEHVANTRGLNPTVEQYAASAALVSWLCDQFGIPADRSHILGHSEADTATTHRGCPNDVWDLGLFHEHVDFTQQSPAGSGKPRTCTAWTVASCRERPGDHHAFL